LGSGDVDPTKMANERDIHRIKAKDFAGSRALAQGTEDNRYE